MTQLRSTRSAFYLEHITNDLEHELVNAVVNILPCNDGLSYVWGINIALFVSVRVHINKRSSDLMQIWVNMWTFERYYQVTGVHH